jgi:type I restriction enzyme S subunit
MSRTPWRTIELQRIAAFRNGINYTKASFGRGFKVINVNDFQDYTVPIYETLDEIKPEGVITEDSVLRDGDVLFVRSNGNRELIGRSLFIQSPPEPVTHSGFTIRVRFTSSEVVPRFYAYAFRTRLVRDVLVSQGGGTNISNLNQGILAHLRVALPPVREQQKIASILSAYDDLVENNTRRIAILEEMARLLYQEWFVKFRFPGHHRARMVASPLGRIPEEWKAETVGDVLAELESGSRPKGGIDPNERGVPSIGAENIDGLGRYDYSKDKFVTREFFERMRRGVVRSGDVLLYKDGAHIGKKSLFRDGYPHEACCINEHVFILRGNKRMTQTYLFFWLDQHGMTHKIRNLNANAAQPGINQAGVRGLPIVVPPQELLDAFETLVDPLMGLLFSLAKRQSLLRRTRDLLLPKLISGELDVSTLHMDVPEEVAV